MLTRTLTALVVSLAAVCSISQAQTEMEEHGATNLTAESPPAAGDSVDESSSSGETAASDVELTVLTEGGYVNERGQQVIDLLEQEYAYLAVRIEASTQDPVVGVTPSFSVIGTSRVLEPKDVSSQITTDDTGVIEFAVVAGEMGLDQVTVTFGQSAVDLLINIISLEAAGYPAPPKIEGGLDWAELTRASVRYQDGMLVADFPASVKAKVGKTVRLSGFIVPLESELRQRHFLLTSNPPSCFFHVPGGPAGAIEVRAPDGVEISWDPIVLEGRFEAREKSDDGVLYRLHDARLVEP